MRRSAAWLAIVASVALGSCAIENYEPSNCDIEDAMLDMVATPVLRACAERGQPRAQAYLGMVYWGATPAYGPDLGIELDLSAEQLNAEGRRWLESAANLGSAEAQNELGFAHLSGEYGLPTDFDRAFALLVSADASGDRYATYNLARMHFVGQGTPRSRERAMRLLWRSALRGHPPATCVLAFLHEQSGDRFSHAIFYRFASMQDGGEDACGYHAAEISTDFPGLAQPTR
jgi:TPR repeat protein